MPPSTVPKAPRGLSAPSRALWEAIVADYVLMPHHLSLLEQAMRSLDRAEAARRLVDAEGLLVAGKLHPLTRVERDSRDQFARIVKQLGLDLEALPPPSSRRPR